MVQDYISSHKEEKRLEREAEERKQQREHEITKLGMKFQYQKEIMEFEIALRKSNETSNERHPTFTRGQRQHDIQ